MRIDDLLSRFKIQTKVSIFVVPFILCICAVGVIGFATSRTLSNRLVLSSEIMRSLGGFRDVSAAMNQFLEHSSTNARDAVLAQLANQKTILETVRASLAGKAAGASDLTAAIEGVGHTDAQIETLWKLFEDESAVQAEIKSDMDALTKLQAGLKTNSAKLQFLMKKDTDAADKIFLAASKIDNVIQAIAGGFDKFDAAKSVGDKQAAVKALIAGFSWQRGLLESNLPVAFKLLPNEFDQSFKALQAAVDVTSVLPNDTLTESAVAAKKTLARLIDAYGEKMREAAAQLTKAKTAAIPVDRATLAAKQIVEDVFNVKIQFASFLLEASKSNQAAVSDRLQFMKKSIGGLLTNSGSIAEFKDLGTQLGKVADSLLSHSQALVDISEKRSTEFAVGSAEIGAVWQHLTQFAQSQMQSAGAERDSANSISIGTTLAGILIAIFAGIGLVMTFKGPIGQITSAMRKLSEGKLDTAINGQARVDEIGEMARALGVFKQNAVAKIEIERQSEAERATAEAERLRNDQEKLDIDGQIDFAVNALAAGLGRLSQGDISQTIETPFFGRLEQLRSDFNTSLLRLQTTMANVRDNIFLIQRNAGEMSAAVDELSKRTEQQAASLEQTAAAVEEITVTVKSSSERAQEANQIVSETKQSADASSVVVANAIDAMGRIEGASNQIVQIISVIDEIAFQTNLLALNAGIEAARAGEAGKGFAVVAQEVRELAQRSAQAAQEIKGLIETSSNEVSAGSQLVQETGRVLTEISEKIVTVSERVEMIAVASRDQALALGEVNASVNSMDHMTQQNAAMVEETNAATQHLATEADNLMALIGQFRIGDAAKGEAGQLVA